MTPDPLAPIERVIHRDARAWARRSRARGSDFELENLVAEGWLVAVRVLAKWDPARRASLATYLSQALRNRYTDLLDAATRRPTVPLSDEAHFRSAGSGGSPVTLQRLEAPPESDVDLWWDLTPPERAWLTAWVAARGRVRDARAALGWSLGAMRAVRRQLDARCGPARRGEA